MAARFGEFVAVPATPHAEHRNEDFLYVKLESDMGQLLYRHRVILYGLEAARGAPPEVHDIASRLGDWAIQPIQGPMPMELGETPRDKEMWGATPSPTWYCSHAATSPERPDQ